jgi:hypothetical protein
MRAINAARITEAMAVAAFITPLNQKAGCHSVTIWTKWVAAHATRNTPNAMNIALKGISRRAFTPRYVSAPDMTMNDRPISASDRTCNVSSGQPHALPTCNANGGAAACSSYIAFLPRAYCSHTTELRTS